MAVKGITGEWQDSGHRRCKGKRRFYSEKNALQEAERLSRKDGELTIAYECVDCKCWHCCHADQPQKLARDPALLAALPRTRYPDANYSVLPGCCSWCSKPVLPKRLGMQPDKAAYCSESSLVTAARLRKLKGKEQTFVVRQHHGTQAP